VEIEGIAAYLQPKALDYPILKFTLIEAYGKQL
jgi:hypothetical protein